MITAPIKSEIKTTIAREALNFQKRKATVTGNAFWMEKMATIARTTITTTRITMRHPLESRLKKNLKKYWL
jgi:hypothetical protein